MSVLRAEHIYKQYPGTLALNDVSVSFESGKIHAFVGKNGSGKSTLIKIFSGAEKQTEGSFYLDDQELVFSNTLEAFNSGMATVYQELSLVPTLSVAENILLGRMPVKKYGMVDFKKSKVMAKELLDELEVNIPVDALIMDLPAAQRQMVEIAKAVSYHPKVLMLDEPTSSLARHETEALFKMIRKLKEQDIVIIYVSHKLHELWKIADTCTVLRDGRFIGTKNMEDLSRRDVIHMMFGDVKILSRPDDLVPGERVVLETKNLTSYLKFKNISFQLHEGEVLGIAGMIGAGRTELLRSIFGADDYDSGEIIIFGQNVKKPSPRVMMDHGLAMIQENRQLEGLVLPHSIKQNLTLACTDLISGRFFVNKEKETEFAVRQVNDLGIKVASIEDRITSLSGGNAQKVVVGNWLNTNPKIMIFDEPSKGIDVNAKQQIFQIIWDQARKGISSIVVSSELEELIEICHRIIIMIDGEFVCEVDPKSTGIDDLYAICMEGK